MAPVEIARPVARIAGKIYKIALIDRSEYLPEKLATLKYVALLKSYDPDISYRNIGVGRCVN